MCVGFISQEAYIGGKYIAANLWGGGIQIQKGGATPILNNREPFQRGGGGTKYTPHLEINPLCVCARKTEREKEREGERERGRERESTWSVNQGGCNKEAAALHIINIVHSDHYTKVRQYYGMYRK